MLLLAMISLLVGAVLAQRFKIMILIPAIGIMLVAAVGAGVTQAHIVWWTILMIAAAGASMQVGYVIGLGIRHILEAPTERAEAFGPALQRVIQYARFFRTGLWRQNAEQRVFGHGTDHTPGGPNNDRPTRCGSA